MQEVGLQGDAGMAQSCSEVLVVGGSLGTEEEWVAPFPGIYLALVHSLSFFFFGS